jgi:hypothetical protein
MTWNPEALTELCNQTMCETSTRDPREYPWGLFTYGDAPPAIGGGVGVFQWFGQLPELLAFISDLSAAGYMTFDEEEDWHELRGDLRQIAAMYEVDPEQAIRAFNKELVSLLQITWIGRFEDLINGDDGFAAMVRARFRDDWDDKPAMTSIDAIKEDERQSFLIFLSEYGN